MYGVKHNMLTAHLVRFNRGLSRFSLWNHLAYCVGLQTYCVLMNDGSFRCQDDGNLTFSTIFVSVGVLITKKLIFK